MGLADAALVLRPCREDGALLKPTDPARLTDRAFQARPHAAYLGGGGEGSAVLGPAVGEVWTAASVAAGRAFYCAFAASLSAPFDLLPRDVVPPSREPRPASQLTT